MKQVLIAKIKNFSTFITAVQQPLFLNQMMSPNTAATALLTCSELAGCHRHHHPLPDNIQISRHRLTGLIQLTTILSFHSQIPLLS